MRKILNFLTAFALFCGVLCFGVGSGDAGYAFAEEKYVYIGGNPVGITLNADGLIVTGIDDVATDGGNMRPLAEADLKVGDVVKALDGVDTGNLYDFRRRVAQSEGNVTLTVERENRTFDLSVTPVKESASGEKRLGLFLKEDVGGVGTLTFVTEDGAYAALGHHVCDPETGLCASLQQGKLFDVEIKNVVRGEVGRAGGLQAEINRLSTPVGYNEKNTEIGIYGEWKSAKRGERIRVAARGEARMGRAQVLTTLRGDTPEFYDIDIVKVVPQAESAEKGLVIAVKDPRLIAEAGGIVQGMSGSPIVQNGTLVGAVTHVFVTDPTRGYGVHARFMLDEAESVITPEEMRDAA